MNFIIYLALKSVITTALVLAYIEAGPGGDTLNSVVSAAKDVALKVDWGELKTIAFERTKAVVDAISNEVGS